MRGPVEDYVVKVGPVDDRREELMLLCPFHGQAWPRVGEDEEEGERRTRRVRAALAGRPSGAERKKRRGASFSATIPKD
jgi:hypothetical protein